MKSKLVFGMMVLFFSSNPLFAAELDKKYESIHLEAAELIHQGDYRKAEEILEEFLNKEKDKVDPFTMQAAYSRYAEVKSVQGKYKEAAEILQKAIDDYGILLPRISENLKEYKKYANKPQVISGDWPKDEPSCISLNGRWDQGQVQYSCNLPTQDGGKECRDLTECQGYCAVDGSIPRGTKMSGKCSEWTGSSSGCANLVYEGVVMGAECD